MKVRVFQSCSPHRTGSAAGPERRAKDGRNAASYRKNGSEICKPKDRHPRYLLEIFRIPLCVKINGMVQGLPGKFHVSENNVRGCFVMEGRCRRHSVRLSRFRIPRSRGKLRLHKMRTTGNSIRILEQVIIVINHKIVTLLVIVAISNHIERHSR